jgi:hypothetical protein
MVAFTLDEAFLVTYTLKNMHSCLQAIFVWRKVMKGDPKTLMIIPLFSLLSIL